MIFKTLISVFGLLLAIVAGEDDAAARPRRRLQKGSKGTGRGSKAQTCGPHLFTGVYQYLNTGIPNAAAAKPYQNTFSTLL